MSHHLLGQLCALGAAVTWALAVVLFKRSGERMPPVALNLFKNIVGMVLLAVTLAVLGQGPETIPRHSTGDLAILAVSGFVGIAVADTLLFYALDLVGVGIVSVVDATYTPFALLSAWLLLGETVSGLDYLGGALILAALLVLARQRTPDIRDRRRVALGMALGAAAMGSMAFGIVLAKPVLERFPLIWATEIRLVVGTVTLAALWSLGPRRRELRQVFQPDVLHISLPASVLGAYVALLLWTAGFKYTWASVAAILNQTSIVFAIVLASLLLGEPFTRRKLAAAALAFAGVAVVTLG